MSKLLILLLLFPTVSYAKVMPGIWDGKCIPITQKYEIHSEKIPDTTIWTPGLTDIKEFDYTKGNIPPALQDNDSDIISCLPPLKEH